ncbi:hypothetical protein [Novipirellula caenicola]|uniref:Uncharacterized protein n=1 Tax=Novipirellula caenicola TaxID=1536901 RepID=A0ABP9VK63_9BACT
MSDFKPRNLQHRDGYIRFEDENELEYEVYGDDSRFDIARELAANSSTVLEQTENMIRSFIKFDGEYHPNHVEVLASNEDDGSSCLVRFSFEARKNPHEFGYTYFDVYVSIREPPNPKFWPTKFVVGFW